MINTFKNIEKKPIARLEDKRFDHIFSLKTLRRTLVVKCYLDKKDHHTSL